MKKSEERTSKNETKGKGKRKEKETERKLVVYMLLNKISILE